MVNIELWETKKKQLGLTFDELSRKSGIPKRTILGVFRKEVTTPRIDTVQAIEEALGLTKPQVEFNLSEQEREIISMFRSLPDKLKQLVVDQLIIFSTPKT